MFILNRIQTMSGYYNNLCNDLPDMEGLVDILRLSPQDVETLAAVANNAAHHR